MPLRLLVIVLALCALSLSALAKKPPKVTPQQWLQRSDAQYYYPQQHGLTDLVVDVTVDAEQSDPLPRDMQITYAFADVHRQGFHVANATTTPIPGIQTVETLLDAMGEYIVPQPSEKTFTGLALTMERVTTQFPGVKATRYLQVNGKTEDPKAAVKEYRVLLDEAGLAYRIENVMRDGSAMAARLENVKVGDRWLIGKITTRLPAKSSVFWKIDTISYDTIHGYILPVRITSEYRDLSNQPMRGVGNVSISLTNYRINTGEAQMRFPIKPAQIDQTPPVGDGLAMPSSIPVTTEP